MRIDGCRRWRTLAGILTLGAGWLVATGAPFKEARIYIEYNDSANDLGFHVSLDAEDWRSLRILNPSGVSVFEVEGRGGYRQLGMTELFFEGAEPSLDEFPVEDLLALFPAGRYRFLGTTVGGERLSSAATLSHAVPDGPVVFAEVEDDEVTIRWEPVSTTPPHLPPARIVIAGYQVIAGSFQVTLPATATEVTLPAEFVDSLGSGEHAFEVLAIEASGNQSITEGTFALD